jgi:hypothetical protein
VSNEHIILKIHQEVCHGIYGDILVYSKLVAKHEEHFRHVLQILKENKLYAKLSKCEFFSSQVEYLGFIVSRDGMLVDPKNI